MSDQFEMSGDFRGAIINIKSTLKDVHQSIGDIPSADDALKEDLQKLIENLETALEKAPQDKTEEAQAVAHTAQALVEQAKAEKPNKTMLQITGEGLKQAAQNLAEVLPPVVTIASQIIMAVGRLTGSPG